MHACIMHACMHVARCMHLTACHALRRDILLFPRGNKEVRGTGLSLYLNVSDCGAGAARVDAQGDLPAQVVNQANPEHSVWKGKLCWEQEPRLVEKSA